MIKIYGNKADHTKLIKYPRDRYGAKMHEAGDLLREELVALELEIRREILDFIGFELRWMKEIGEELGHLSLGTGSSDRSCKLPVPILGRVRFRLKNINTT